MMHVRRATASGKPPSRDAVHLAVTDAVTMCGWVFIAHGMFEGKAISMAMETKDPLSCGRCAAQIRKAITVRLPSLSMDSQEDILEMIENRTLV